jgi:hypothetical protein
MIGVSGGRSFLITVSLLTVSNRETVALYIEPDLAHSIVLKMSSGSWRIRIQSETSPSIGLPAFFAAHFMRAFLLPLVRFDIG